MLLSKKAVTAPEFVVIVALPAVLASKKTNPPKGKPKKPELLFVITALPAELRLLKVATPPNLLVMIALAAVENALKSVSPPNLLTMVAPPAELESLNVVRPLNLLVMVALPAVENA